MVDSVHCETEQASSASEPDVVNVDEHFDGGTTILPVVI